MTRIAIAAAIAALVAIPAAAQVAAPNSIAISTAGKTAAQVEAEARAAARDVCHEAAAGTVLPLQAFATCVSRNMAHVRAQLANPALAKASTLDVAGR